MRKPSLYPAQRYASDSPENAGAKVGLNLTASSNCAIAFCRFSSLGRLKKYRPLRYASCASGFTLGAAVSRDCSLERQLHVDLSGDRRRQFRLERQHVARAAFEALGPEMLVRPRVDQLRRDPHLVAGSRHRTFHDRVDVELLRNVRRRRPILALELHRRSARDDAKLADGRQVRGQFIGHPFSEVVLVGIARVVVEWKHGNRSNDSRGARRRERAGRKNPDVTIR